MRFPAVNGSALDAARLVTPKALEEMQHGGFGVWAGPPALQLAFAEGAMRSSALPANPLLLMKHVSCVMRCAAAESGYRTKHYQLTYGSLGCFMSHLQLYQHILRSGTGAAERLVVMGGSGRSRQQMWPQWHAVPICMLVTCPCRCCSSEPLCRCSVRVHI